MIRNNKYVRRQQVYVFYRVRDRFVKGYTLKDSVVNRIVCADYSSRCGNKMHNPLTLHRRRFYPNLSLYYLCSPKTDLSSSTYIQFDLNFKMHLSSACSVCLLHILVYYPDRIKIN